MKNLSELWRVRFRFPILTVFTGLQYEKNTYIDQLDKIVDKYNKTYNETIKNETCQCSSMCGANPNGKDPKFRVDSHERR